MNRSTITSLIFWICLTLVNYGLISNFLPWDVAILNVGLNVGMAAIVFYTNALWGFKKFFKGKNNFQYVIYSVLAVLIFTIILGSLDFEMIGNYKPDHDRPGNPQMGMMFKAFFWVLIFQLGGTILLLQSRLQIQTVEAKQIGEEKLQTELKLLKAQINPHFLFNALNNIYSLSYLKSDAAPDSILKLSQMLRYVIEDCKDDHVFIEKEVDYIKSYLAFQEMKSPEKLNVVFDTDHLNSKLMVSPLLFMPFIENSFKYSRIEDDEDAFIKLNLSSVDNIIRFTCRNSIPLSGRSLSGAGTGIENVKQRLEILYPGAHELDIREKDDLFIVNLEILPK